MLGNSSSSVLTRGNETRHSPLIVSVSISYSQDFSWEAEEEENQASFIYKWQESDIMTSDTECRKSAEARINCSIIRVMRSININSARVKRWIESNGWWGDSIMIAQHPPSSSTGALCWFHIVLVEVYNGIMLNRCIELNVLTKLIHFGLNKIIFIA